MLNSSLKLRERLFAQDFTDVFAYEDSVTANLRLPKNCFKMHKEKQTILIHILCKKINHHHFIAQVTVTAFGKNLGTFDFRSTRKAMRAAIKLGNTMESAIKNGWNGKDNIVNINWDNDDE